MECPKEVLKAGYASAWGPLYSRAVPGRPKDGQVPVELVWHDVADAVVEKCPTGDAYTDGSAKGWFWRSTRAGWSFVVLDKEGKWRWTAKGTLGGTNCSSFRAELKALLEGQGWRFHR